MKKIGLLIIIFVFSSSLCFSGEIVSKIEVEGNKIISTATVISNIKLRANQPYNENVINGDVKSLMSLGYFENIEVEKLSTSKGIVVKFKLVEKPVLKEISIEGANRIRKRKVETTMNLKEGIFLDEVKVKEAIDKVKDLYKRKGFSQAVIAYDIKTNKVLNEALLKVVIDEKGVAKVKKVIIKGVKSFPVKKIKKLIKTKKAWFFGKGIFKKETLEDDIKRINDFYIEQGFSEVELSYAWDYLNKGIYVTIKVDEGERQYIGKVSIEGNRKIALSEFSKVMELKEGDIYSKVRSGDQALKLQTVYFDKGYIFAHVKPLSHFNPQTKKIDIVFHVVENEINFIERIFVRGNQKTKDKVVRRELRIYPGDKFEGSKIRKSRKRLENLGFFEEIKFDAEPVSKPNWQNLIVEVKEAKTGYLSFGGGYSSVDEFIGFVELRQRNFDYRNWKTFTGAGQDLSFYASFGTVTEAYELNFTNPYIFDTPYSFGFDAFKREHKREEDVGYGYHTDTKGGKLRLGREFSDYLKGGIAYSFEKVQIDDVVDDASQELKDEIGSNDLSSLEMNLAWDKRNNVFNPSEGFYFSNAFQMTGGFLGGDKNFTKFFSRLSFYFPLVNESVLEFKIRSGLANPFSNTSKVPIYERFFAGGASTIRGYQERKVGPIDSITEDPIGGEALFIYNMEYNYPLTDFLKTAVFFDTGNIWKERNDFLSGGLKSSVGLGLRVRTPIGPISIDYGWPLNKEPGEEDKEGRFHFNITRGF
ncbi:MAG: outer membrane protein assembly factor BamA [Candidatus Omnitrophica bacterium]|nr:outer membrane protein assembly factor BamA [Candidatus Omnitrophota bacterium]